MGHNDAGRDQARRFLAQARHQTDNALAVLRKKAGTGPDTGLDVRGAGVAFDPLDTASGRLALAVGDLLEAVALLLGDTPPPEDDGGTGDLGARLARLEEEGGWTAALGERLARLEASVSVRDYRVDPPTDDDRLTAEEVRRARDAIVSGTFGPAEPDPETAPVLLGEDRQ